MDGSYCATSATTRWQASFSNDREESGDGLDDDDD
jgi:hypothetical protein